MNHNCEDAEALLSGYLDAELSQGDRQRVEIIMEDCKDCAQTFEDMKKLRGEIGGIEYEHMTEAERLKDPMAEAGASIGQVLVIGGFVIFYGTLIYFVLKGMLADEDTPFFMKIGLPAIFLGMGIMLTSVIIDRIKASKTDPYNDVEI